MFWPGISTDIKQMVKNFDLCNKHQPAQPKLTHYAARPSNPAMGEPWHRHLRIQWKEVFDGRRLLLTIPCDKTCQ